MSDVNGTRGLPYTDDGAAFSCHLSKISQPDINYYMYIG